MLRRLERGLAIPRDLGWASGMAATKMGKAARTKEREKYILDRKRSSRLKKSREDLQALRDMRDALDAFIAMREPMRKAYVTMQHAISVLCVQLRGADYSREFV